MLESFPDFCLENASNYFWGKPLLCQACEFALTIVRNYQRLVGLNNINLFPHSFGDLESKSRYLQGWFLLRSPSLACRQPSSPWVFKWSFLPLYLCLHFLFFGLGFTLIILFSLNYLFKDPVFKKLSLSEVLSEVPQSCPTLRNPMDCSLSGSSVHGIFQARMLEWIAISFSRGSSQPRRRFTIWATREWLT